jgi:hypothetical protein
MPSMAAPPVGLDPEDTGDRPAVASKNPDVTRSSCPVRGSGNTRDWPGAAHDKTGVTGRAHGNGRRGPPTERALPHPKQPPPPPPNHGVERLVGPPGSVAPFCDPWSTRPFDGPLPCGAVVPAAMACCFSVRCLRQELCAFVSRRQLSGWVAGWVGGLVGWAGGWGAAA